MNSPSCPLPVSVSAAPLPTSRPARGSRPATASVPSRSTTSHQVVLSNFIPSGGEFLNFAGLDSATGDGGNGRILSLAGRLYLWPRRRGIPRRLFQRRKRRAGHQLSSAATAARSRPSPPPAISQSIADIEASSGANGRDVIAGKGGSIALTANNGAVTVNNRIQVSHNSVNRRSASGGSITLKSGKTSGVAINVGNTGQLLSLLDAAAPGPGGKVIIQATASTGNSQINISGKVQADRGTVDVRNSGSSGQVNLTNADVHADTLKVAALGNNGVLRVGGGSLSADTTLQLYAPNGNGQVVFIGNVSLNGNSTKSIAGDSVTINNGVVVTVTARRRTSTSTARTTFRKPTTAASAATATPAAPSAAPAQTLPNLSATPPPSASLPAARLPRASEALEGIAPSMPRGRCCEDTHPRAEATERFPPIVGRAWLTQPGQAERPPYAYGTTVSVRSLPSPPA